MVGRLPKQRHPGGKVFAPPDNLPQPVQSFSRQVGSHVGLAVRSQAEQQQPGLAADIQHAAWPEAEGPPGRVFDPLAHLLLGKEPPGAAADPARHVEGRVGRRRRSAEGLIEQGFPRGGVLLLERSLLRQLIGAAVPEDDVGHQTFCRSAAGSGGRSAAGSRGRCEVLPGNDGCAIDFRVLPEHGRDLAGLYAVAPQLHLIVQPAKELERSVWPPAAQITGTIDTGARLSIRWGSFVPHRWEGGAASCPADGRVGEGIGQKALPGQLGPPDVPSGHACAADTDLARDTDRNRFKLLVEEIDVDVLQRPADRGAVAHGIAFPAAGGTAFPAAGGTVQPRHAGSDRRLGRPVGVEETAAQRPSLPAAQRPSLPAALRPTGNQFAAEGLAGGHHRLKPLQHTGAKLLEHRRGKLGHVKLLPADEILQRIGRLIVGRLADHQAPAGGQGVERLRDRTVERGREELQHAAVSVEFQRTVLRSDEVDHAAVLYHHALGASRRAGRVDNVGQLFRADAAVQRGPISVIRLGCKPLESNDFRVRLGELAGQLLCGDNDRGLGVLQHTVQPPLGLGGIDGQVCAA